MKNICTYLRVIAGISFLISLFSFARVSGQEVSDAIVEKHIKEYTLTPAGELEFRHYKKTKLLTYNSIHRMYGETFLLYNPKYQQLKVLSSTTTMRDGSKVRTPDNAFNEVLPRFAANAPAYNHLKEMVVTHTGLEVGATIELDYKIISSAEYLPGLLATEVLSELSPVKDMEVIVRVPADKTLSYKLLNLKSEPVVGVEGQYKVYHWYFKELAMSISEANQPEGSAFQPTLLLSSLGSHPLFSSWLSQQAFANQDPGKALNSVISGLRQEEKDDLKLALKLQNMVVNEIVYCPVPLSMTAYRGRSPQEVWQSAYGTSFEKANLLSVMLRTAKIPAQLVVVTPSAYSQDFVSPGFWEDFAVRLNVKKGEQVYLSLRELNAQNMLLTSVGKKFLSLPEMNESRTYEGDNVNLSRVEVSGAIGKNSTLKADFDLEMRGGCVPYLMMTRSDFKASAFIGGMGRSALKDGEIESLAAGHCEAETSLEKEMTLKTEGQYLFLSLPYSEYGINAWHLGELPAARQQPFDIPYPMTEELSLSLAIPSHLLLLSSMQNKKIDNTAGSLSLSLSMNGDKLVYKKRIVLNKNTFAQGYYAGLRELLNTWHAKGNKELVFKTRPAQE